MEKWKLVSSKMALDNKWFKIRQDGIKLPNGKIIDDYFVWLYGDVVLVVLMTEKGEFVLVKQYKHGAGEFVIEFPAGVVDKGETPEEAAHREVAEETGYSFKDLKLLTTVHANPTKAIGKIFIYLAKNAVKNKEMRLDETEDIEVLIINKNEIAKMIESGEICTADSITGFFLALEKLKSK